MKKNLTYSLLIWGMCCGMVMAQETGYELSRSKAPIPENVRMNVAQRYELLHQDVDKKGKKRKIREQSQFIMKSATFVDNLLKSGKVLYNEPMSRYINQIMDHLLKEDPALRAKLHVYISRDVAYNAFATDQGVLLVNVGLLARAKSEAEIAFILCHEIEHYKKKHGIERVKTASETIAGIGSSREKVLQIHAYNRSQEEEADKGGLVLFLKSGYSLDGIRQGYDNMAITHLHFENIPFSDIMLEQGTLNLPDSYMLEQVRTIRTYEETDDEMSTHPNTATRRKYMAETLTAADSLVKRQDHLLGIEAFQQAQSMARMEMADLYMQAGYYDFAFYTAYVLGLTQGEDPYLQRIKTYSLYTIAMHASMDSVRRVVANYKKIQGEPQRATFFFQKMSPKELCVLALRENYLYWMQSRDSLYLRTSKHLMKALGGNEEVAFSSFAKDMPKEMPEATAETVIKYGLTDLIALDDFEQMYVQQTAEYNKYKKPGNWKSLSAKEQKNWYTERDKQERKAFLATIKEVKRVVFINPRVTITDNRQASGVDMKASAEMTQKAEEHLKKYVATQGYTAEILSLNDLEADDIQALEDYRTLMDYLKEYSQQKLILEPSQKKLLDEFQRKYNTRYIGFYYHDHNVFHVGPGALIVGWVFTLPYTWGLMTPWFAYHFFAPTGSFDTNMLIYDLETGKKVNNFSLSGKGHSFRNKIPASIAKQVSVFDPK
ncbi:MAG: M48 family metallopeptidase [Bacteroidetes bacterium]|nr:M48 family metallopeptidase [Bacteroidota bacterium]